MYRSLNVKCSFLIPIALVLCLLNTRVNASDSIAWPKGKTAISLSYDDSLHSQLDHAVPALGRYGFLASFYVLPTSDAFQTRLEEWRMLSMKGHELGNHTLLHSCSGSLPNRDWVESDRDLDTQSAKSVVNEVRLANVLLQALDGKTQRTFTIPCGDLLAGETNYVELIRDDFLAIKGQGVNSGFSSLHVAINQSGADLINLVKEQTSKTQLINILFHGVGADHLSVSTKAHDQLLKFLSENQDIYWVDTYQNIMSTQVKGN